jgi:hypothetical protein
MLYKLSFTKTSQGLLRVSAIYQDDHAFLHLLKHAGVTEDGIAKLGRAVEVGFVPTETPACREEVELSDGQLSFLRLAAARSLYPAVS